MLQGSPDTQREGDRNRAIALHLKKLIWPAKRPMGQAELHVMRRSVGWSGFDRVAGGRSGCTHLRDVEAFQIRARHDKYLLRVRRLRGALESMALLVQRVVNWRIEMPKPWPPHQCEVEGNNHGMGKLQSHKRIRKNLGLWAAARLLLRIWEERPLP